tara:strand:- start:406 stop:705 length:300 start_codon:yes stop_codon:yes gene_type:complete
MSIKLDYILRRNKSNLKTFVAKNKLTSYEQLLEYCEMRRFIPCTEAEYILVAEVKPTLEPENETKVSREVSKTPKPRKRRHSSKKQQPAPKLSDSSDKR